MLKAQKAPYQEQGVRQNRGKVRIATHRTSPELEGVFSMP